MTIIVISYHLAYGLEHGHMIFHFRGADTNSAAGSALKFLGDVNLDGYDDIAFNSQSPVGTYIYFGGNPIDTFPDYFLDGNGRMGDYLDYTGDHIPDLVISAFGRVIYLYEGYEDSIGVQPVDSIIAPEGLTKFWICEGKDLKRDPVGDLLVHAYDPYEGEQIYLYVKPFTQDKISDWHYLIENYSHSNLEAGFIDFNADAQEDIFLSMSGRLDSLGYVYLFLGPEFAMQPDIVIAPPDEIDSLDRKYFGYAAYNIGDINADGWEDLGVLGDISWAFSLIYLGGPDSDTLYDYRLDGGCSYMSNAGDLDGDGFDDLAIGGSDSYYGRVIIYLGGPQFDTIRDDCITRNDLPSGYLDRIGYIVSPVGDFNRDGHDDLLFSCKNWWAGNPGDVFIFSWGDDILDVKGADEVRNLPNRFLLNQNYPNPFNSLTTIEFELPRRDIIDLKIYNILGQKVAVLADNKPYPPGRHTVRWNGMLSNGNPAPSGVYFYRLRGNKSKSTKRMVLLK